jgi:4-hydroxybenzoate polyprenyltransferase
VKKKTLAIGVAVAALLLVAAYWRMNSSTPPGQEPLATLTTANFVAFEAAFDQSTEGPRLVLLLSPT